MGKRRRIMLAVLIVAVSGGLAWMVLRPREVVYSGKPLHFWIDILEKTSPGFDPPPIWQSLGTNEVPVLTRALELRDSRLREWYLKTFLFLWPKLGPSLTRHLPQPLHTEDIAINSLMLLQRMDRDERPAIPALLHLLNSDNSSTLRGEAAYTLGGIGASSSGNVGMENKQLADVLIAVALNDKDPHVRYWAAEGVNRFDGQAARKAGIVYPVKP